MKHSDKLDEFYKSLESINVVNINLDSRRGELKQVIENFTSTIQTKTVDEKLLKQNEQLGALLNETLSKLKASSKSWVENFAKLLEREKFRSDLQNYFIVMIFGKVKAGKSTLGNFIAKHNTAKSKAVFFKYDEAGKERAIKALQEIDDSDEFATNNLECTTEIQGFRLSGLAWIDTPGLGSMIEVNGKLAKEYIQSADYIIYPTSSTAPLQRDEIEEFQTLFDQKKPVTICITRSDTYARKKDANGKYIRDEHGKIAKFLVNKSQQDQQKQEQYVKDEIAKITRNGIANIGDIFSLSVHVANEGLKHNDEEQFVGSNIPKFYELLTEVIKHKAASLKASTPYDGLIAFIDNELLNANSYNSIESLMASLYYFDTQVDEAYEKFKIIKENTTSDIKTEVDFAVSKHASSIDKSNYKEMFGLIDQELDDTIAKVIGQNIKDILKDFHVSLSSLNQFKSDNEAFEIQDELKEIKVPYKESSLLSIFVKVVTIGIVNIDGSRTIKETIVVGDNKVEAIISFKQNRAHAYIQAATDNYDAVIREFFEPLRSISNEMKSEIEKLKSNVVTFKKILRR